MPLTLHHEAMEVIAATAGAAAATDSGGSGDFPYRRSSGCGRRAGITRRAPVSGLRHLSSYVHLLEIGRHDGPMHAPTVPGRTSAGRPPVKWIVALVAGFGVAVVALLALDLGKDDSLRLDDLPQGVTAHEVAGRDVFIVRRDADVKVFLSDARHLPEDALWWCPSEQIFFEVEHGSQFDRDGLKIGGPAQGGLNQYPVVVEGGKLVIDSDEVIVGDLAHRGERPAALDGANFSRINAGPGSFCKGAVASPPEAARAVVADGDGH